MNDNLIALTSDQSRQICLSHLVNALCLHKQYLDDSQIRHYKFIINEFASLYELDDAQQKFDAVWPQDVIWDEI